MWVVKGSEVPILAPWVCVKKQDKEGTSCDSEQIPEADWETQHGDLHRGISYLPVPSKQTRGWDVIRKLSRDFIAKFHLKYAP